MNKRTLLLLGAKGTGALALFGTGIGAYVLLSPQTTKIVKGPRPPVVKKAKEERIVKTTLPPNTIIKLTHVKEFVGNKFFITCNFAASNTDEIDAEKLEKKYSSSTDDCKRYIESKASGGHPIWVYKDKSNSKLSSPSNGNWKTYQFTYQTEIEENTKEYYGLCFPNPDDLPDSINNPCSNDNLPEGWTKSLVSV